METFVIMVAPMKAASYLLAVFLAIPILPL